MSEAKPNKDAGLSAWADTSQRHHWDQLLRRHGFEIAHRRGESEPTWRRKSKEKPLEWVYYRESEALQIRKAEIEQAVANATRKK